ncbi:AraC family transcriptional regulator [Paenibacillus sp. NEAU-GSW1]|uniref:AraC family transcriptional regulator n=1 Tax=Paenibacillus sp. NEAU-GSW1 TaxID=2682486 RepID=UPI0012E1FD8D|nr:AraC family transcriptional regulator [Paenibacillus sp. NEAU-GSW1]MUT65602.1 helix-turn-helix domain-containing protein [Paenibacillus sp. NEAU-GSW1]
MKANPSISRDHIELPHGFPIIISQTEGVSLPFQRLHWHTALEINYIVKGSGYYLINGNRIEFQQGDILLINSNDLHRAFENEGLVMQVVMFDPSFLALEQRYDTELLNPFREMGSRFDNVLDPNHMMARRLGEQLMEMQTEYKSKQPHYEAIIRSELVRFLALVNRHFARAGGRATSQSRGMETIREALRRMDDDVAHPWTLRELAEIAHLSPSRFSALFVQTVGTSPMDYLIQLRLSHAVDLIETTDQKMIEIASECGFRNLSNFNRLFKQHVGKLPTELRASKRRQ